MGRIQKLEHEFVEFIPEDLAEGVLYISCTYATAAHKCCCGCGLEVVTPLSPTDWRMTFDGESISLSPSVGNWGFECQSHYWISGNRIRWAGKWSKKEIELGRRQDAHRKDSYFGTAKVPKEQIQETPNSPRAEPNEARTAAPSLWASLAKWFGR